MTESQLRYIQSLGRGIGLDHSELLEEASKALGWDLANEDDLSNLGGIEASKVINHLREQLED